MNEREKEEGEGEGKGKETDGRKYLFVSSTMCR